MPSTGMPAAARLAIAPSMPVARSHSRSARKVLLVPGRTIPAAASISAGRVCSARARPATRTRPGSRSGAGRRSRAALAVRPLERDAVLLGQRDVEPRDHPERGHAGALLEPGRAGRQQRCVAAEAVEQEARQQVALRVGQAVPRAQQVRERPAAVDVAAEQHGSRDLERDRHVDDVAVAQVDLRRAARALDHDDVVVVEQAVEGVAHDGPELRAALAPGQLRDGEVGRAQHDDLRARVGLGLDQHRVHAGLRRDARGCRLHDLRAAELAAVVGHAGVVAHVLRLERRDPQALVGQDAAERGGQIRLARMRGAALHHQRLRSSHRMSVCGRGARERPESRSGLSRARRSG